MGRGAAPPMGMPPITSFTYFTPRSAPRMMSLPEAKSPGGVSGPMKPSLSGSPLGAAADMVAAGPAVAPAGAAVAAAAGAEVGAGAAAAVDAAAGACVGPAAE